jgi:hypothetical protein
MEPIVKVGRRFKFTVLTDDARTERQGVVIRVLSNREEGFGLDVDQYMSYWVEAHELPETEFSTRSSFLTIRDLWRSPYSGKARQQAEKHVAILKTGAPK